MLWTLPQIAPGTGGDYEEERQRKLLSNGDFRLEFAIVRIFEASSAASMAMVTSLWALIGSRAR